ncbi:MAG: N-acetyl-gamma-glutamyl-phosphate reductase [bacterium]|nr:N-acetyl-gamma-glutamyl-phosphate reductase [bacterium]
MTNSVIAVGIAGATGYSGCQLIRLLARHPYVRIAALSHGPESPDLPVSTAFPELASVCDLPVTSFDQLLTHHLDLVFLALPHCAAMAAAPPLLQHGTRVIDLSADYRLRNPALYAATYGSPHHDLVNLQHAVYGLSEWYRNAIRSARLVANPGCYVTCALLPLIPLLRANLINPHRIIIDAKSGVSGAGKKITPALHFCEVNESFKAYNVFNHRHTPEIEQELSAAAATTVRVTFTPHLLPTQRGIFATIYVESTHPNPSSALAQAYHAAYAHEFFIRVKGENASIALQHVTNTNFCDISWYVRGSDVIITSALDNLVKGAAGQAVQNMNIMFGFDERTGLL